jgi:hypothetical protein
MVPVEHILGRGGTRFGIADARPRSDQQRAVGPLEHVAHSLDGAAVLLAIRQEVGEIVVERGVDYRIRLIRAGTERLGMFQIAAMDPRAGTFEGARAGIGSRQAENLVPRREQFGNDTGTDEAGGAGEEDTHEQPFDIVRTVMSGYSSSCKSSDVIMV